MPENKHPFIAIIGTGFSGICMGIQLKKAGIHDFVMLEKASEIGGTWRDNIYPGAACDVKSHLYSYSFEPNPDWTRVFSPQQEIWDYLKHCIEKHDLQPHIRFNWEMKKAEFDDSTSTWSILNKKGDEIKSNVMIMGTGALHLPSIPDIPGIKSFRGRLFHSSRWEHDYDLKEKNVAVIGTGASSIQFVPEIIPIVKQLYLFQRTPPWVMPKPDGEFGSIWKWMFKYLPFTQRLYRYSIYWMNEMFVMGFTINTRIMKIPEWIAKIYISKEVKNPELREKLTPKYTFGCKRVLLTNNYLSSLCSPNAEVITDSIDSIGEDFIKTKKGEVKKIDAIICGTGFHVINCFGFLDIKGSKGLVLNEIWKDKPEAFLGTTVSGFPNLFIMTGPNTGLGHTSMIFMIESQTNYVIDCIKTLRSKNLKSLEVKKEVQDAYNKQLETKTVGTVWTSGGCNSWYLTPSGKNAALWPGFTFTFRLKTKKMNPEHYEFAK